MSYFTDQLKRPWTISNPSTTALVNKKLRKPGGAFKKFTDWGRDVAGKGELVLFGTNSTDDKIYFLVHEEEYRVKGNLVKAQVRT